MKPRPNQQKTDISWEELMGAIKELANKLPENCHVWGVPRNGIIIAGLLSHQREGIKLNTGSQPPDNLRFFKNHNFFIIDDISDSGQTLKWYKNSDFKVATLYRRGGIENNEVDICVEEIFSDDWLVFPWETE